MNEQNNESQPTPNQTQPPQNKPALAGMCRVCGGECRIQATMCDKCETALRGWIHDYPSWIQALREFLDSTAHYGATSWTCQPAVRAHADQTLGR